MLLVDAGRHEWLENRGPRLTLVGIESIAAPSPQANGPDRAHRENLPGLAYE